MEGDKIKSKGQQAQAASNIMPSLGIQAIKIPQLNFTPLSVQIEDEDESQKIEPEHVQQIEGRSKNILKKQMKAVLEGQKISRFLTQQRNQLIQDLDSLEGDALVEEVIILLKKSWKNRTYRDNRVITKYISDLSFFRSHFGKSHEKMIIKCAQYFKYTFFKHGEKVFEQGECGDKFYVIIKGNVSIHVDFKKQEIPNNGDVNQYEEVQYLEKVHIRDLYDGDSFGELALIDKKPRSATITCIGDCHFITFDKQSFDKILKNQQIKKFKEELERLKKNYLFSCFSGNSLKTIYLLFQIVQFNKGDQITKEGEQSDQIYIIREGEFKVSRRAYIKIDDDASCQLNLAQKKKEAIEVDLGILSDNQSFGEEEFFTKETRKVNVVCISRKGELMIINRREFFKKIGYDTENIKKMERKAFNKNIFREQQFERALSTYGHIKSQICEDKQGQYLDQQLSHIEQDYILQKEINEIKLQNDLKNKSSLQNSILNKNKSLAIVSNDFSNYQNKATKYHFIRKKVTTSHRNSEETESIQKNNESFFESSFLSQSSEHNKKSKLETITSMNQSFNSENQNNYSFCNKSNVSKDQVIESRERSPPDNQIQYYLKRMSVMSASLDLRRNSKSPLIDLNQINKTAKNVLPCKLSQFNDAYLNLSEIIMDSQDDEKRSPFVEDLKPISNLSQELKHLSKTKESPLQQYEKSIGKNNQMKELIDQELHHHYIFLHKRKNKTIENQFFKNLDEKLLANKSISKQFKLKEKPVVQINKLFTLREKQITEAKKIHRNSVASKIYPESKEDDSDFQEILPSSCNIQRNINEQSKVKLNKTGKNRHAKHMLRKNQSVNTASIDDESIATLADQSKKIFNIRQYPTHLTAQLNSNDIKNTQTQYKLQKIINSSKNRSNTIVNYDLKEDFDLYFDSPRIYKKESTLIKKNLFIKVNDRQDNLQSLGFQFLKSTKIGQTQYKQMLQSQSQSRDIQSKPINPIQSFNKTFLEGNNINQAKTSIKKELIFNESNQKLPLKYFSSRIKEFNDETQTKGRKFNKSFTYQQISNPLLSSRNVPNKVIDLSIFGIPTMKPN